MRKTVTPTCKLWPRKQLDERFTTKLFKIVWFVPKFYMILFDMLHTFYLSRFFPSVTLTKYVSSYCKINVNRWIMRVISTRTSINGVRLAHHISWPIIFIVFFETMLGGEHSGKVSRKFIGNFFFWWITLKSRTIDVIVFGMLPARGIWRETVSLLDVMWPSTSQWQRCQPLEILSLEIRYRTTPYPPPSRKRGWHLLLIKSTSVPPNRLRTSNVHLNIKAGEKEEDFEVFRGLPKLNQSSVFKDFPMLAQRIH